MERQQHQLHQPLQHQQLQVSSNIQQQQQVSSNIQLPPGFRFHPSDEELIVFYLRNKATSRPLPASIVADIDLYKFNPWELPNKALFGNEEWYFFSPRDRKYPKGARPNRTAASGYWKATGIDKPILTSNGLQKIGVKKSLVFYKGRPTRGIKTGWIMHEYRLPDNMIKPSKSRSSMRLDDWVLCRVRHKDSLPENVWEDQTSSGSQPPRNYPASTSADPTFDIIANYRNNGCPMLAYILSSHQGIPRPEVNSTSSFQGGRVENNCATLYEEASNVGSSLMTNSSINSPFNPLKRKPTETVIENDQYGIVHPSSENVSNETTDNLSFSGQYPPHDSIFSPAPSEIYVELQELNTSPFMGRDLL